VIIMPMPVDDETFFCLLYLCFLLTDKLRVSKVRNPVATVLAFLNILFTFRVSYKKLLVRDV